MISHSSGFILRTSEEMEADEKEKLRQLIQRTNETRGDEPLRRLGRTHSVPVSPPVFTPPRNAKIFRSNFQGIAM